MASDHQQQQQQQQQLPTQQQTTQQQQTQPLQTHQQQQSTQQQQQQSLHQQQSAASIGCAPLQQQQQQQQHQTSTAASLPQQTELLSSSERRQSSSCSGNGGGAVTTGAAAATAAAGGGAAAGGVGGGGAAIPQPLAIDQQQQQQPPHTQQFCLRWNNFQSNIVNSFETLLNREELVDVTLTAEGRSLRAHRVLLSACSPYFRDLFQDLPSHQHPVIVLRDTRFLELKCLLCFIYHGEVNVSQDNLSCLLNLAENLKVKGLAQEGGKRHSSKEYEFTGRGVLSPDRDDELSDGGEQPPRLSHHVAGGGRMQRPPAAVSPGGPQGNTMNFSNFSALGSLLRGGSESGRHPSEEGAHRGREMRDSDAHHTAKGGSGGGGGGQHHHSGSLHHHQHQQQQQQQQHHSPPTKRRKRLPSPQQQMTSSNNITSHHHHQQQQPQQHLQQQPCSNNSIASSGIGGGGVGQGHASPPPSHSNNNNSSSGVNNPGAHNNSLSLTPTGGAGGGGPDEDGHHAVNLSVCPSTSPPRLMVPKLELMSVDDESSNGAEKERLERLEQRERLCNLIDKERIAGMIKLGGGGVGGGGYPDSDMEEEEPPPHDEDSSGDMESHGGGLSHPLSHLPPGLQQSFVSYPPTTHAAAAAAAAAAHFANTFTPGPSGVPSSASPASWRSHPSDQNPNSPQGRSGSVGTTMSALETLVDSLGSEQLPEVTDSTSSTKRNPDDVKDEEAAARIVQETRLSSNTSAVDDRPENFAIELDSENESLTGSSLPVTVEPSDVSNRTELEVNMEKCKPDNEIVNDSISANSKLKSSQKETSKLKQDLISRTDISPEETVLTPTESAAKNIHSKLNLDHPTALLKCELLLDEESNMNEVNVQVSSDCLIENLEKIDKEEMDVACDLESDILLDAHQNMIKSLDGNMLNENKSRIRSNSWTESIRPANSASEKVHLNSLSNVVDSLSVNWKVRDANFTKRRRSVDMGADHNKNSSAKSTTGDSVRSNKVSLFNNSAVFSSGDETASSSQFPSNNTHVSDFNSTSYVTTTHRQQQSPKYHANRYNKRLFEQKRTTQCDFSAGLEDEEENNDISIIEHTTPELESMLLFPETSLHSSSVPGVDQFPSSMYPLTNSLPYTAATSRTAGASSLMSQLQSSRPGCLAMAGLGPSPSRQSCTCPLCGRHIAQRRSLKQHLMSNYHKLTASEADHTVRRTLSGGQR